MEAPAQQGLPRPFTRNFGLEIADLPSLAREAEAYRQIFNHIRPHEALGLNRPIGIHQNRTRKPPTEIAKHPTIRSEFSSQDCRRGTPPTSWQSYSAGHGSKGPRNYDWAWVTLAEASADRWLLVRRNPGTGELAFYLTWSPTRHGLRTLVRVAATRWAVEETFQAGKSQVGLDHGDIT